MIYLIYLKTLDYTINYMTYSKRILVAASMNGGAEAVAPVAKRLTEKGREVTVVSFAAATSSFKSLGIEPNIILEKADMRELTKILSEKRPDVILTDTQFQSKEQPITLEQMLWMLGRNFPRLPTIAVIDTWGNYLERFSILDINGLEPLRIVKPLTNLPNRIVIPDEFARREMVALGFDSEVMRITGNPYFEHVSDSFERLPASTRKDLLSKPVFSEFHPEAKLVVFMSDGMPTDFGFTEKSVMQSFVIMLDMIAKKLNLKINLIVRPHPFRGADAKDAFDSSSTKIIAKVLHNPVTARGSEPANEYSMEQLLKSADIVVGTYNNPLVTSTIVGIPTIFYMPGLNQKYNYYEFLGKQGHAIWLREESGIEQALTDLLNGKIAQKPMENKKGAIDSVIRLIDQMNGS